MKLFDEGIKITKEDILEFEEKLNTKFPEAYVDFLLESNGGTPEEDLAFDFIDIASNKKNSTDIREFYIFYPEGESSYDDIIKVNSIMKPEGLVPEECLVFADDTNQNSIDIYIGENRPDIGINTYSTIGLSKYPIDLICEDGREIRVEYIGMCNSDFHEFSNIVASCAFNIIKDNYICKPGMVAVDAIADYCDELEMKHIYYTVPIIWENLQGIEYDNKIINWLYMVPISDKELEYINEYGDEKFEELLEEKNINVFDIYRKSIL